MNGIEQRGSRLNLVRPLTGSNLAHTSEPRLSEKVPNLSTKELAILQARKFLYSTRLKLDELEKIPEPDLDLRKQLADLEVKIVWGCSLIPGLAPEDALTEEARKTKLRQILARPVIGDYLREEVVIGPGQKRTRLALHRDDIESLLKGARR